jgi:hypothetical protein
MPVTMLDVVALLTALNVSYSRRATGRRVFPVLRPRQPRPGGVPPLPHRIQPWWRKLDTGYPATQYPKSTDVNR